MKDSAFMKWLRGPNYKTKRTILQRITAWLERFRIAKRLGEAEAHGWRVSALVAVHKRASDKALSTIATFLNSRRSCCRCGVLHYEDHTTPMKSPEGQDANSCRWCVSELKRRGYKKMTKQPEVKA